MSDFPKFLQNRCGKFDCAAPRGLCVEQASSEYSKCEYWVGNMIEALRVVCVAKGVDLEAVTAVRVTAFTVFLNTRRSGVVCVERSELRDSTKVGEK